MGNWLPLDLVMAANDAKEDIISGAFLRAARSWLSFWTFFRVLFLGKFVLGYSYLSGVPSFRTLPCFHSPCMYFYRLTRTIAYLHKCRMYGDTVQSSRPGVNGHLRPLLVAYFSPLIPESPTNINILDYSLLILRRIKTETCKRTDNFS